MPESLPPSPMPLYHRVFGVLRQRMLDGVYGEGERLAPEDELAAEFQVSRATIRQAVGELVESGLVSRQQGRGTFVMPAPHHAIGQVFTGSLADLISETKRARISAVEVEHQVRIPDRIAGLLELDEPVGTTVRRARAMDGRPFAYTVNFLPSEYGRLLTPKALGEQGLMHLLERGGITIGAARQSIRAQLSDVQVARNLEVELGAPVLFVERLLLSPAEVPVEFVQTWYRGDTYVYQVDLNRDDRDEDLRSQLA